MTHERDTVRLPLEPLRRQAAEATGNSASFLEITGVSVDGTSLEVEFEVPDTDVPVVEVVVEGPDGRTDTTSVRLDKPAGLKVHGELLRVEYAGRDAETNEVLVSVSQRTGESWRTILGCGQMWAVEAADSSTSFTCYVETPGIDIEESAEEGLETAAPEETGDGPSDFDGLLRRDGG